MRTGMEGEKYVGSQESLDSRRSRVWTRGSGVGTREG